MLVALDCANEHRMAPDTALLDRRRADDLITITTTLRRLNLVVGDASTSDIQRPLRGLDVELTPEIAEALYVAGDRHRALPVHELTPKAPASRRAGRGRRRRPPHLPGIYESVNSPS